MQNIFKNENQDCEKMRKHKLIKSDILKSIQPLLDTDADRVLPKAEIKPSN